MLEKYSKCKNPILPSYTNSFKYISLKHQSSKFKRVSLNETIEFLFGVLTFCRFWFRTFEKSGEYEEAKWKNISKKKYWYPQNCLSPFVKLVFITIPCRKFWPQSDESMHILPSTLQTRARAQNLLIRISEVLTLLCIALIWLGLLWVSIFKAVHFNRIN